MMTYELFKNSLIRQVVELLVEFHPDMTKRQREESLPFCVEAITLVGYLYLGLAGLLGWILL